jgi:hypothetical protein
MLLSAYVDGELSSIEQRRVEEMLAGSAEAQSYVGDLRALNGLSSAAFPAVSIGSAAIGTGVTAKLSGSAIKIAAQKAALSKGFLGGIWGLTGVATAAVAVVAGVTLSLKSVAPSAGKINPTMVREHTGSSPVMAATPAVGLDTSSVIVPRMTPVELVKFAVKGTLPIDSKRDRYIRLVSGDESSGMQREELNALEHDLRNFDWNQIKGLDSIQEVVRTALLNYSGDRLAIRKDIGDLRLRVLKSLELQVASQLPEKTRQQWRIVRRKIEDAHPAEADDDMEDRDLDEGAGTQFYLIDKEWSQGRELRQEIPIPMNAFVPSGNGRVVIVGVKKLNELREKIESPVLIPSPPPVPQRIFIRGRVERSRTAPGAGANGPGAPSEVKPGPTVPPVDPVGTSDDENQQESQKMDTPPTRDIPRVVDLDSLLGAARQSLERARTILEHVDVRIRVEKDRSTETQSRSGAPCDPNDSGNKENGKQE